MRIALGCAAIALGAIWTGAVGDSAPKARQVTLKIDGEGGDFPGQVWGRTIYPPLMSFRVVSGKPSKGVVLCTVVNQSKPSEPHIKLITLHCEDGIVLELEGIDMGGGQ